MTFVTGQILTAAELNAIDTRLTTAEYKQQTVTSVADVRLLDKTKIHLATTKGYWVLGDGGGSQYWYDSSDTTSADDGYSVIVAADGGRWKLLFNGIANAKQTGAKGDGSTNDTVALQAAMDYLDTLGGGVLFFPPGTYRVKNLWAINNCFIKGAFGSVILKLADGSDGAVLANQNAGTGVSIDWFGMEGIICDGNASTTPRITAASAVSMNICSYFYAKDCTFQNATGYGLGLQAVPDYSITGEQTDIYLENCYILDNGIGTIAAPTVTYDGLDVKYCRRITLNGCYAHRNQDKGFNIRGEEIVIVGGSAHDNIIAGYGIDVNPNGASLKETSCVITGSVAKNNGHGFAFGSGATPRICTIKCDSIKSTYNNANGVYVTTESNSVSIMITNSEMSHNSDYGFRCSSPEGEEADQVLISNCIISDNSKSGVFTVNTRINLTNTFMILNGNYGFYENGSGSRSVIGSGCNMQANALGTVGNLAGVVNRLLRIDYSVYTDIASAVASAATITVPDFHKYIVITGSVGITNITAGRIEQEVIMRFQDACTVTDGGNLVIAGDFSATSQDVLHLVCDGTNWFEISRSVN